MEYSDLEFDETYIKAKNHGLWDWLKWYYREYGLPLGQMRQDIIECYQPIYGKRPFSELKLAYAGGMIKLWCERECHVSNDNDKFCGWPSDCNNNPLRHTKSPSAIRELVRLRLIHMARISRLPFRPWPTIHVFSGMKLWQRYDLIDLHRCPKSDASSFRD